MHKYAKIMFIPSRGKFVVVVLLAHQFSMLRCRYGFLELFVLRLPVIFLFLFLVFEQQESLLVYINIHGYRILSQQSFDTNLNSIKHSVAEI